MTALAMYLAALLIGVVAGLRVMTALAAVTWAAHLGAFRVEGTGLAFMGARTTPWVFTVLAALELVGDQLPTMQSRKAPLGFVLRIASGGLSGAAITISRGSWLFGTILGCIGAIIGTLGGYDARTRLARRLRRDSPAAFLEDAVAIAAAVIIVAVLA